MREQGLPRTAAFLSFNFMKNLIAFSAVAAALFTASVAPVAKAAVLPQVSAKTTESNSVSAVRALIARCLPGVLSGKGATTAGFSKASEKTTRRMLGSRDGSVYMDFDTNLMMVDFHDQPACRIIAMSIDPAVLADLVMRVFAEASTPFERERFNLGTDGSFTAVYSSTGGVKGVVIRISTDRMDDGSRFATLTVERDLSETAKVTE